jgi:hypothetical protein
MGGATCPNKASLISCAVAVKGAKLGKVLLKY